VEYDDFRQRTYSVPTVIGGAGLVAVLAAIVIAVVMVGESSVNAVPRRIPAVMPTATTAFVPPATSAPAAPAGDTAFFGQLPQLPTVGQVLAP
jgi:hypothetical protein